MLHGSVLPLLPENLNLLNSRKITKPHFLGNTTNKIYVICCFSFCVSEKYLELEKTFRDLQNSYHSCVRLLNSVFVNMVKNTG